MAKAFTGTCNPQERNFDMSFEFIRLQQYLNQHHTSSNRRNVSTNCHGNDIVMTTDNRPLIASFDHPLRRQLREMQDHNLENLLGLGPHWVDKDHLRKAMPTRYVSKSMRSSSDIRHPSSRTMKSVAEPLVLPKVRSVTHSYNSGDGAISVVIDTNSPVGQSITARTSYAANGCSLSYPHHVKYSPLDLEKPRSSRETRNEDEVLIKYCKWFDSLSSSILGSNIGDLNPVGVDESKHAKNKDDEICPVLQQTNSTGTTNSTESTTLQGNARIIKNVKNQESCIKQSSCRTEKGKRENLLNNEEKDIEHGKNIPRMKDIVKELNIKDAELSRTPQNCLGGKDLKSEERYRSSAIERKATPTLQKGLNEKSNGKKNEMFVDRLVLIVKDYIEYRKQNVDESKKGSPKQENQGETKTVKENMNNKEKGGKQKKRIEVLRRLVAKQESRLAKLKRQADGVFNEGKNLCEAHKVGCVVENEILRHDLLGEREEDGGTPCKKARLPIEKLAEDNKTSWKKRWLSDWSSCTADSCMSKAD